MWSQSSHNNHPTATAKEERVQAEHKANIERFNKVAHMINSLHNISTSVATINNCAASKRRSDAGSSASSSRHAHTKVVRDHNALVQVTPIVDAEALIDQSHVDAQVHDQIDTLARGLVAPLSNYYSALSAVREQEAEAKKKKKNRQSQGKGQGGGGSTAEQTKGNTGEVAVVHPLGNRLLYDVHKVLTAAVGRYAVLYTERAEKPHDAFNAALSMMQQNVGADSPENEKVADQVEKEENENDNETEKKEEREQEKVQPSPAAAARSGDDRATGDVEPLWITTKANDNDRFPDALVTRHVSALKLEKHIFPQLQLAVEWKLDVSQSSSGRSQLMMDHVFAERDDVRVTGSPVAATACWATRTA